MFYAPAPCNVLTVVPAELIINNVTKSFNLAAETASSARSASITLPTPLTVAILIEPKLVIVAAPVTAPVNVIVGSLTLKSRVWSPDSYVTPIPDSVLLVTIAPTRA